MVKVVDTPIISAAAFNSICSAISGSVVFHYAIVKEQTGPDKSTTSIEYRSQVNSVLEMEGIAMELERLWNLEDVLLIRRTGCLAVGKIISLAAVSSPNSEDAFEACKFGISRTKEMSAKTKIEKFADPCNRKKRSQVWSEFHRNQSTLR